MIEREGNRYKNLSPKEKNKREKRKRAEGKTYKGRRDIVYTRYTAKREG